MRQSKHDGLDSKQTVVQPWEWILEGAPHYAQPRDV